MLDSLATPTLQIGNIVRVRAARRRDVVYTIAEVTPSVVVAVNNRGGEARYEPDAFELVQPRTAPSQDSTPRERVGLGLPRAPTPGVIPRETFADTGCVRALPGEEIESMVRRFKKSAQRAGILYDLRRREHFVARGQRRRQKDERARRRREAP